MGRIAAERADRVIVTIGTAGQSGAERIPAELHEGAAASNPGAPCEVIGDRGEAIAEAVRSARAGDLVLVVGRGDAGTPVRMPSGDARPFDDGAAIRALLREREY
jgi:UDP-N-acetylmuramoyl-L-alanyl-D-glutamate--2,6-diaminopimelate ligase